MLDRSGLLNGLRLTSIVRCPLQQTAEFSIWSLSIITSRYPLSKLIVHLLFANMARLAPAQLDSARVIFNLVNPLWCGTELGRAKEQGIFERICFGVMGRTSEDGGRALAHAVTAGLESDREYLSECIVKPLPSTCVATRAHTLGRGSSGTF
jgi:hypothetical protein